jgi:hypothetical protein
MDEPLYAPVHPPPSVVTTDSELSSLPVKRLQRHSDLDNLTTLQDRYARTRSNLEQSNAMIDNVMTIDTIPLTPPGKSSSEVQSPRRSLTVTKKWPLQDSRLQVQWTFYELDTLPRQHNIITIRGHGLYR